MVATMMIWGMAFVAMKVSVPETGPFWMASYRTMLGLVVVLPLALWSGLSFPNSRTQWGYMVLVVFLNIVIPIILIGWAQLYLDAGISALLIGVGPIMALFIGNVLTTDEHFNLTKLIAVSLGFAGVVVVVGPDFSSEIGLGDLLPKLALILAALLYVIAGFTIRKIDLPPLSLAATSLLLGTSILVPLSLVMSGPIPLDLSPPAISGLLFAGMAGTGLGFISRYYLIQNVGYSIFSIGINMIPVFGVIFGALILGEVIEWTTALALVLVVGGLFVARLGTKAS